MAEHSSEMLSAIREIRDLVRLMAEPAIAARDRKLRDELRRAVGNGVKKGKAVSLMDGSRTQRAIQHEAGIDPGNLSRLVKKLKASNLLLGEGKQPKLAISIPSNFFETGATDE